MSTWLHTSEDEMNDTEQWTLPTSDLGQPGQQLQRAAVQMLSGPSSSTDARSNQQRIQSAPTELKLEAPACVSAESRLESSRHPRLLTPTWQPSTCTSLAKGLRHVLGRYTSDTRVRGPCRCRRRSDKSSLHRLGKLGMHVSAQIVSRSLFQSTLLCIQST